MKILHVITSLRTGGAEKLMVDLLPRLKERGHDVDLLLFDGIDTPFRQAAEKAGIKIYDLGKGGSVYSPLRLLKLIPHLGKYDIVHTHNTAPQLFAAIGSLFSDKAILCTTEHNTSNRRRKWRWFAPVDRWMYSRYRHVICISQKAEDNLRDYIGASRVGICTINNGIDLARFSNASNSHDFEQIACRSRKLLMVASFRAQKDQDTIIRAMSILPPEFHLFLVGDGSRRPVLEQLSADLGLSQRVHFMGIRNDIPNLLHAADYIVMSSHFEGLSLSSVEGMSVGKPFLASDVDGLREVVKGYGILFNHEDEKDLAAKIVELENSPALYSAVSEACNKRAQEFDISKMADGYSMIYETIL